MMLDLPLPPLLHVPGARLNDLDAGSRLEWIETDGRGGWSAGTAAGASTRREHGLLVVARKPPLDRVVLLSRLEETLITPAGERIELSVSFYPDAVYPSGHLLLAGFSLDPWPVWRYRIGDTELVKELFHSRRARALVLRYRLRSASATLELRPLFAGRPVDDLRSARETVRTEAEASERLVAYQPIDELPPVILSFADGEWQGAGTWYYNAIYPRDRELGRNHVEDLYSPGLLRLPLEPDTPRVLTCGLVPARIARSPQWTSDELRRRERIAASGRALAADDDRLSELASRLALAADAFLVERGYGKTIIAAYPAAAERGRDAMIALPGLCLALGRLDDALAVLRHFAAHVKDGLIPARFPEHGNDDRDVDYASADASLWFIEAAAAIQDAGVEARDLWPAIRDILRAYEAGTTFGIGVDSDGLVKHGAAGPSLTWPGIDTHNTAATRAGKAVEVNALWYNALLRAANLPYAENAGHFRSMAERCRAAFQAFRVPAHGFLADVIDPDGRQDATCRPAQLFAVSLPFSPVSAEQGRAIVQAVERELLVAFGIRTSSPAAPGYRGRIEGNPLDRERAARTGGAWPWLIGPFVAAYLRVHDADRAARTRMRDLLLRFEPHLLEYGIGHIAEVCAGDPPHPPAGAFACAASTAQLLQAIEQLRH
jgi:predicted glycogen debranching enzyme